MPVVQGAQLDLGWNEIGRLLQRPAQQHAGLLQAIALQGQTAEQIRVGPVSVTRALRSAQFEQLVRSFRWQLSKSPPGGGGCGLLGPDGTGRHLQRLIPGPAGCIQIEKTPTSLELLGMGVGKLPDLRFGLRGAV